MKNYELITALSKLPAGAEVEIHMLKTLNQIPKWDDGLRIIEFPVQEVQEDDGKIQLDGWD